ncbi:MAG: heme exporter protein CcmB [Gammaproteobacteria bacterium]|nr:heme exporter protein CcmB [Gammaproteobacteria bacterium]|tara:strand:+ start:16988 stop:17656 length:669 start_codon:yes stop_codon:yes gene_type:complete
MNNFLVSITKEFALVKRSGYEAFVPIIYLFLIMLFFSIAIGYMSKNIFNELVPLFTWIACLLICILNIEKIFSDDFDDGTLEILLINFDVLEINILAKIFSHWMLSNFPIVIIAPIVTIVLGLDTNTALVLFISLLLGTPTLSLIGSIAAALTVGLKNNKILISIVVLPLYVPVLIFGTSAVNNSYLEMPYTSELYLLGILFLIFLLITPFACSKALKISLD